MKLLKSIVVATALALAMGTAANAQRTDIIIGMVLEPPHLDPTAGAAAAIKEIGYQNIFEGLTRMNDSGEILPGLARSWDISDDGTVYTFHLAEGATFHDGTPFTAGDVKFTLDRARAEDSTNPQKGLFAAIENVEVIDDTTVEVSVLSAAATLDALVADGVGDCAECQPLEVVDAQRATGLVETSRGPANAPIWVYSIAGSAVKITRVAVDESVTVDPPPWNAEDPPEGISIDSATGTGDSKRLTVSFIGAPKGAGEPCGADYTAEAVESDLAIVVIVHERRNPAEVACTAVGATRTATVKLADVLGKAAEGMLSAGRREQAAGFAEQGLAKSKQKGDRDQAAYFEELLAAARRG